MHCQNDTLISKAHHTGFCQIACNLMSTGQHEAHSLALGLCLSLVVSANCYMAKESFCILQFFGL